VRDQIGMLRGMKLEYPRAIVGIRIEFLKGLERPANPGRFSFVHESALTNSALI